jgi:hypothetical protein
MTRARRAVITAGFAYAQYAMAIIPGLILVPLTWSSLGARTYGLWLTTGELLAYAAMVDPGVLGVLPWLIAEADGASDRSAVRRLFSNGVVAGLVAGLAMSSWPPSCGWSCRQPSSSRRPTAPCSARRSR